MQVDKLIEQYIQARGQLESSFLKLFRADVKEMFNKHPEVTGVMWTQYAPHFNDGEPCLFSVNSLWYCTKPFVLPVSGFPDDEDGGWIELFGTANSETPELVRELSKVIHSLDSDLMQNLFGPDSQVVITPEELIIEDYSERHE
jgi:hypothetical protein